ncbi:MAG: hypothetical protein K0Q72_2297 [Armatimonadetes bacterium]|nr:hypothetical protein [Armatimonadota bacterium]
MLPNLSGPRVLVLISSTLLAIGLTAAVSLAMRADPRETRALKTRGAIVGVTYGDQPLRLGSPLQKLVLSHFPQLQSRIGGAIVPAPRVQPATLVVWQSLGELAFWDGVMPGGVAVVGEHGEEVRVTSWADDWSLDAPALLPVQFTAFPRRGRRIRVRSSDHALPEIVTANPASGPHPNWKADPVGTVRRDGPVEVTLDRLVVPPPRSGAETLDEPKPYLDLRVRETGRAAARDWSVEGLTIEDATGNVWEPLEGILWLDRERLRVQMGTRLLSTEPVYRVRVELVRRASFPPEDTWTLPDLTMPPPRKTVRMARRATLHGYQLEASELLGLDAASRFGIGTITPSITINLTKPAEWYAVQAFADTKVGRIDCDRTHVDQGPYSFSLPSGRRFWPLSVKVVLTPRRTVEFLAHASRPPDGGREATGGDYIRSSTRMPSRLRPSFKARAVRSQRRSRLRRTLSGAASITRTPRSRSKSPLYARLRL